MKKSPFKKLIKFISLPARRKLLMTRVLLWLMCFRLCLWILPFKLAKKWLPYENQTGSAEPVIAWNSVSEVAQTVRLVSRLIPYATCLTQALTTKAVLKKLGQESNLKIGICRNTTSEFEAHAWIEMGDRIVIGKHPRHHQRYTVLNPPESVIL